MFKTTFGCVCLIVSLAIFGACKQTATMQGRPDFTPRTNVPIDSIILSDPFILADEATGTYYMTGTGGMLWKSKDLAFWDGPYHVAKTDSTSWMGPHPMIWAAELHKYNGKYYYFATFTNRDVIIDTVQDNVIERRASHVLVSDKAEGPYVPMNDPTYLPADKPTLDGTFWVDTDGKPYMVYCYEWLQAIDGTIEKIELKPDLSGSIGEGKLLFRASDSPWSRETNDEGIIKPNRVTDGPYLFRTGTGRLGMIWTSWVYSDYTQGVAYSESGTLDGPWIQETEPITPPNFGHGMLFQDFNGKWLMSVHSHKDDNGRYIRVPHLFEVNLSGDKLIVGKPHIPVAKTVPQEKDMAAYLMVYHRDETHSLHMAVSHDGYTFTAVNNGNPVIAGDTIADQKGIRDPHIFRGPDGAFYLTMTDLHLGGKQKGYRETQWERDGELYGWGNNKGIVLMKSKDLINWTRTNIRINTLSEEMKDIGCAWAPETTFDESKGKLMIHYTTRFKNGINKLYYFYVNDDFNALESEPKQLFEYPNDSINTIDGDITKVGDKYHLFYVAHEKPGGIRQAVSDKIDGGYVYDDKWYDFEPEACEAPNVWKRIGEDKWVLMYDVFSIRPNNFGFTETTDFENFTDLGHFNDGVMKTTNFTSPKHGAVIHLTAEEAKRLEDYWNK